MDGTEQSGQEWAAETQPQAQSSSRHVHYNDYGNRGSLGRANENNHASQHPNFPAPETGNTNSRRKNVKSRPQPRFGGTDIRLRGAGPPQSATEPPQSSSRNRMRGAQPIGVEYTGVQQIGVQPTGVQQAGIAQTGAQSTSGSRNEFGAASNQYDHGDRPAGHGREQVFSDQPAHYTTFPEPGTVPGLHRSRDGQQSQHYNNRGGKCMKRDKSKKKIVKRSTEGFSCAVHEKS